MIRYLLALLILLPSVAWAGPSVPQEVQAGVAFPVVYTAEARDGSGPVLAGTMNFAVAVCDDSDCTSTPNLLWCATLTPSTCTGTTPTWFSMDDEDSMGTTYGQYVDWFKAPAALDDGYLLFFFRDNAGLASDDAVQNFATTWVFPETRATEDGGRLQTIDALLASLCQGDGRHFTISGTPTATEFDTDFVAPDDFGLSASPGLSAYVWILYANGDVDAGRLADFANTNGHMTLSAALGSGAPASGDEGCLQIGVNP